MRAVSIHTPDNISHTVGSSFEEPPWHFSEWV